MMATGYYILGILATIVVWRMVDMLPRLLQDDFTNSVAYVLIAWMLIIFMKMNNARSEFNYLKPRTRTTSTSVIDEYEEKQTANEDQLIKGVDRKD